MWNLLLKVDVKNASHREQKWSTYLIKLDGIPDGRELGMGKLGEDSRLALYHRRAIYVEGAQSQGYKSWLMAPDADTFTCIKHVLRRTVLKNIFVELNELGHVTPSTYIYLQQRILTACSSFITTRTKQLWESSIADRILAFAKQLRAIELYISSASPRALP